MSEVLCTMSGQWQGLPFVVQSLSRVRLFATPMDCNMPGFPAFTTLWSLFKGPHQVLVIMDLEFLT